MGLKYNKHHKAVRTYVLSHAANAVKVQKIVAVLSQYQTTMKSIQSWQMRRLYEGSSFNNRVSTKDIPSGLSRNYTYSALNQVVAGLLSWQELLKDQFSYIVSHSMLPEASKVTLYRINARGAWYQQDVALPILDNQGKTTSDLENVAPEVLFLARRILHHIRSHCIHTPNLARTRTMRLDNHVVRVQQSKKANSFPLWATITTLEKRHTCSIPLLPYPFFTKAPGDLKNYCSVTVGTKSTITVSLVKVMEQTPLREEGPTIGLDFGLNTLFATSYGDLCGTTLYPWLSRIDNELTHLTANLQRQHIPLQHSKRYRNFQKKIRRYVTNEINRCVNTIVERYHPKAIVVEELDFRYGGLSPRLNRLVSRCGRAVVKKKFQNLYETSGIAIQSVNPAYTSQECSGCGYVARKNRNGRHFACFFCHKTLHADLNSAKVIEKRFLSNRQWHSIQKEHIHQWLDELFQEKWKISSVTAWAAGQRCDITPNDSQAGGLLTTSSLSQSQINGSRSSPIHAIGASHFLNA